MQGKMEAAKLDYQEKASVNDKLSEEVRMYR
jgi:hypothetical protein